MITEAIILAGGLGTRLRAVVADIPKCMAPVAGKPFISYVIDYFAAQGINRFVFSVGYKHEVIESYLDREYSALNYVCAVEDEPLGTGGAIVNALSYCRQNNVLILNGDTFFKADLAQLSSFHDEKNAECSICLKAMVNTDRYGVVEIDNDGRIISFKEKRFYETSVINGGVYALNIPSFQQASFPIKFSFEKDYFERYYTQRKIYGIRQDGYFIDIGIPADYEKAQTDLKTA